MSSTYNEELEIALQAVHRASIVTKQVMNGIEHVDKSDASPVTMADFAAQALLISAIHEKFPNDRFVAEESADLLRENNALLSNVWQLVRTANSSAEGYSNHLTTPKNKEDMMSIIDLGSKGETPSSGRVWILDPVDGTAAFMKGQQYVVCLSLTVDGTQRVGVLGCPNLRPGENQVAEELTDEHGFGVVLSAVLGEGAFIATTTKTGLSQKTPVKRTSVSADVGELQFTDSVPTASAHLPSHQKVYAKLGLQKKHIDLYSTQIRYVALALGACDAMVRIPRNKEIRAFVWDHAGGQLIYTEAGGHIVDVDGLEFDFAKGRKFSANWGFVAADKEFHKTIFDTVQDVLKEQALSD